LAPPQGHCATAITMTILAHHRTDQPGSFSVLLHSTPAAAMMLAWTVGRAWRGHRALRTLRAGMVRC
jgi:hypothetical protein